MRAPIGDMALLAVLALLPSAVQAQAPWWADSLGYSVDEIHAVRIGNDGFPYVSVTIDTTELWLVFDTGNMTGVTVATHAYDQLGLAVTDTIRRRDSDGRWLGDFRVGRATRVHALGRTAADVAVREFRHAMLPGLFGPDDLPGSRFTLDYRARVIGVARSELNAVAVAGGLPLVRSARHPRLVLVRGAYRRQPILIELDTGKSRSVVDPAWAARMGLSVGQRDTVIVGEVRIGAAVFDIGNAKPVGLAAIDPDLPDPLVLSLGSDTLSRFVMTVDFASGWVLLWESR